MTEMRRCATSSTVDPCEATLADCPPLERLLDVLSAVDRLQAEAVRLVGRLQETGEAEAATGVPLELWLAARGRRTRSDRRMLGTAADTLARLPAVRDAFSRGVLSWAQVRAIALRCERLPGHLCTAVDDALAPHLLELTDAEPDAIVDLVGQAVASVEPSGSSDPQGPPPTPDARFLAIQPRLDGRGGRLFGELDALGLAAVTQATDPGPADEPTRAGVGRDTGPAARRRVARSLARRRADRLVELCAASLAGGPRAAGRPDPAGPDGRAPGGPGDVGAASGGPGDVGTARGGGLLPVAPTLLLTMTLDSLLGRDDSPAEVVTSLAGGRLRVAADTARRLLDQGGAAVRAIVLDDTGAVLGVGRRRRQPPGWVRDAVLARDAVCVEPGCRRSAATCDLDHARPWSDRGGTDIANLQPVCAPVNRTARRGGWEVEVLPDATRRWMHERSGLSVRTVPTARRLRMRDVDRAGPAGGDVDPTRPARGDPGAPDPPG